jgi:hypothetical protein
MLAAAAAAALATFVAWRGIPAALPAITGRPLHSSGSYRLARRRDRIRYLAARRDLAAGGRRGSHPAGGRPARDRSAVTIATKDLRSGVDTLTR